MFWNQRWQLLLLRAICPSCGNRQWFVYNRLWIQQFHICSDKKPEAPFHIGKILFLLILALGFCSLHQLGADSSKLLCGELVSLEAKVLSVPPHPRASSSPSNGSHEVDACCWWPGDQMNGFYSASRMEISRTAITNSNELAVTDFQI